MIANNRCILLGEMEWHLQFNLKFVFFNIYSGHRISCRFAEHRFFTKSSGRHRFTGPPVTGASTISHNGHHRVAELQRVQLFIMCE